MLRLSKPQSLGRTYSNAFDAFKKIVRNEKLRGLYRGYSTYVASSFAGCTYILTFENVRHLCGKFQMTSLQNFVAGASASVVNQVIMVPIDVLTQHLMMIVCFHFNLFSYEWLVGVWNVKMKLLLEIKT